MPPIKLEKTTLGCSIGGAVVGGILLTTGLLLPLQFGWSTLALSIIGTGGALMMGTALGGYVILDRLENWQQREMDSAKKRIFTIN